ncbi:MAG: helix-turn-helix transcriptional regulator [Chloroflexota bacterium]
MRQKREEKGLTRSAMARAAEISVTYAAAIERGAIRLPSIPILQRLSRVLSIELEELYSAAGVQPPPVDTPPDPRLAQLSAQLDADPTIRRVLSLWETLAEKDRRLVVQLLSDLAALRDHLASLQNEVDSQVEGSETSD